MQILELPHHVSGATYCAVGVVAVVALIPFLRPSNAPNLDKIPTVGSNTWLGSWWAGVRFVVNGTAVVQEGYEKYKGTPFKVSTLLGWLVVVSGRQLVEEFFKCRDDELSFKEALMETLKGGYTLGRDTIHDPWHIAVLRSKLNRNLEALHADIKDEIVEAFDEVLSLEGHEWKSVPALSTVKRVISRTGSRVFVGLPLCRDPDWVDLSVQFTQVVLKAVLTMSLFPLSMAPFIARFMTDVSKSFELAAKHLEPIIEARREHLDEFGSSWVDPPGDLLSCMMEGSEGSQRSVSDITWRMLALNFASIHTSSNSFTQALYNLAANPHYVRVLREEVDTVIERDGWSKTVLTDMPKIDSFMKESQRMDVVDLRTITRKAMKDVTFSDGTVIPKGAYIVVAAQSMHLDDEFHDNAVTFDPFRFTNLPGSDSEDGDDIKHRSVTSNPGHLTFGYGRHACPGRFLAATILNTMLAHLVLSYDIKLEDNATRPRNFRIFGFNGANPTARVMFRRRLSG